MKDQRAVLYSFLRCPYAMRARLALAYSQQIVEIREVTLKNKPESLLAYSAKATVPVLVLNDETVIDESLDIMQWALSKHDPDNWQENLSQQKELIQENDKQFKTYLDHYKYADRHPESETYYRERCTDFLNKLENRLQQHNHLFSNHSSLADMAIFPFIRQFAHVDLTWFESSKWHNLQRWLNHHKSSELFNSIMFKYPTWQKTDAPSYFPSAILKKV